MKEHEVHKYIKVNIGGGKKSKGKEYNVYKCSIPGCKHYLPNKNLLLGRESICHQCGEVFTVYKHIVKREVVKPRCIDCSKGGPKNLRKNKPESPVDNKKIDKAIDVLTSQLFNLD